MCPGDQPQDYPSPFLSLVWQAAGASTENIEWDIEVGKALGREEHISESLLRPVQFTEKYILDHESC